MKFYSLVFLSCAWFTLDVAKPADSVEYTVTNTRCKIFVPNDYVKLCKLLLNEDDMDDYGYTHSLWFLFEVINELGDGTELDVRVNQNGVPTGITMTVPMRDLLQKGDALTDAFCDLTNIPKGTFPIVPGTYSNPDFFAPDGVLPKILLGGNYNLSITMLTNKKPILLMEILADVFSS